MDWTRILATVLFVAAFGLLLIGGPLAARPGNRSRR